MSDSASFLYVPEPSGSVFNMEYYLNIHMPKVIQTFANISFRGYEITAYNPDQPYQLVTVVRFDDINDYLSIDMTDLLADIPNFTETEPIQLLGHISDLYVVPS